MSFKDIGARTSRARSVLVLISSLIAFGALPPTSATAADSVMTLQIAASSGDVNEVNGVLTTNAGTIWLGNGGSTTTSYTGLRFTNVSIPAGATISSAYLQVYSSQSQWIGLEFGLSADAVGNSAAFSSTSRPSQRTRTTSVVAHDDDVNWAANTWYALDEMKGVVQAVVSRADWQAGNSLSIIITGTGSGAYARKFVSSFDASSANAPKLVVTYSTSALPAPTASMSASPTTIVAGGSATLTWTTSNATSVSIDQGIGAVAAAGSRTVTPTTTTTYTLTATGTGGTTTAAATVTVSALPTVSFSASPTTIVAGASATLTWTTSNATSVSIDQGIGAVAAAGSRTVTPTTTTTYTLTATNASGTTTAPVTITVSVSNATLTAQVTASADDVNEVNGTLTTNAGTVWLGNGGSTTTSYTGLRFRNVSIPAGATISSAYLQVCSSQSQRIGLSFNLAADAAGNSVVFSQSSRPSRRTQTTSVVTHNDNVSWAANTWYALDEMKSVVQEVVSRADWQAGNSLSIIINGTASGAYARKYVSSFDASPTNAPMLVVSYTTVTGRSPTATIALSPTAVAAGGSATLSWTTTDASSVSIAPGIGTVSSSGSLSVSPTATTTYTITASNQFGTITQSTTLTVNPAPVQNVYFSVGAGLVDVIPHQLVRAGTDRLYAFASQPYLTNLVAYWTAQPGLPAASTDFAQRTQVRLSAVPMSVSPAYDGATNVFVFANLMNGNLIAIPFDVSTNAFGIEQVIATDAATVSGDYTGTSGLSSMADKAGNLHVVYWTQSNQIVHMAFVPNANGTGLTAVSSPTRVDASGSARHPSLAVSPSDNSVTIAWVSLATTPRRILARVRDTSGTWGQVQNVSNTSVDVWTSTAAGIDIDQGPSLIITSDGVRHLSYIENYDTSGDYGAVHYVSSAGAGWTDQKLTAIYSHDPALATNAAGDLYLIAHGHPNDAAQACQSLDDMCVTKRNSDGTWGPATLFAPHSAGASFDSSPSVKWSVVGWNRSDVVEFLFFQTPYTAPTLFYGRVP
jgi:PKD repeat protein